MNPITINSETFNEAARALLAGVDARSKDILTRRYGLETGSLETLESIGREYGVTRERVRQIEAQAKKLLARREDLLQDVAGTLEQVFATYGGVLADDHVVEILASEATSDLKPTLVFFFLDIISPYQRVNRSEIFGPHWSHPELHNVHKDALVASARSILKKSRHPLAEADLINAIRQELKVSDSELPTACIDALLRASLHIDYTVFDEWGLTEWVETKPRGVGDKAYIVLRRHGKSEHFREITNLINQSNFDHKQAHAQTVHNELIKDDRFVLVGRGMYGLKEWGFVPGTVADVLEAILSDANKPLTRQELLERVLEQRMVKKTTVLLGLQNTNRFQKVGADRYTLRG